MKRKFVVAAAVAAVCSTVAIDALAQAKPEFLIKERQGAMRLIAKYFGPIAGMAQGKIPYNAQVVQRNAGYLNALKDMPWDGFHENTKGIKTDALPAIWEKPAEFKQAQDRFSSEVAKLAQVAGDEAAVKAQFGAVGKSCGGCHETFRQKQ
jgi:cytochrome c556